MHESLLIKQLSVQELRQLFKEELNMLMDALTVSQTPAHEEILDTQGACDFLHIAKSTLYNLVHRKAIPYLKRGRKLYFSRRLLNEWLMEGRQLTQTEMDQKAIDFIDQMIEKRNNGKHTL
ncbi:MAG: helix-turn-helix domain-containing protein [Bacteroidota bacterium]